MFKRNVLENVRYGRLDATDEECIHASDQVNIMKFFQGDKMYQVLDGDLRKKKQSRVSKKGDEKSKVGSKEDPVSSEEKQRLFVERDFLKNPTIMLLNEVTSALDKDNEIEVKKSLDKFAANRTSIAFIHRLNTIEQCDMIYVLENRRLVEKGNHEQLMTLKKQYYNLHKEL